MRCAQTARMRNTYPWRMFSRLHIEIKMKHRRTIIHPFFVVFFLLINMGLLIGLSYQPVIRGDLIIYERIYNIFSSGKLNLTDIKTDPAYYIVIFLLSQFIDFQAYLLAHKVIFYLTLSTAIIITKKTNLIYITFLPPLLVYFDPFLQGYSEFLLRQGVGFIILFTFGFYQMKSGSGYVASVLASFFHSSFIVVFLLLFLIKFFRSIKLLIYLSFISAVIYITNLPLHINPYIAEFAPRALGATVDHYRIGFKPLFFLASFGAYLLLFLKKYRLILRRNEFLYRLWVFYSLGIFVSVLISGLPYHDRIFSIFWACQYFIIYDLLSRLRVF